MAEQWLSIVEYARTFAVSDMTIRRRIKNGKLNAVLKDGKYYIPLSEAPSANQMTPTSASNVQRPHVPKSKHLDEMVVIRSNKVDVRPGASNFESTVPRAPVVSKDVLPNSFAQPLVSTNATTVNGDALLSYCENSLRTLKDSERHVREKYENKIYALEMKIKAKDAEIASLSQQVEDLQLLVKVFEKKQRM